ncbi:hypothetical protein BJP36_43615 [Moorena producens JHB]|uniref:Uncharacterized protein n=1 Tax=Moorena producens (strain JHB) TaxID=1454205 RepID=A0A9Q9STA4_MOOP1|nr:hypothetical protein [Moorena producens]WAN69251.1 hypothetical protein BJP36_43615 [Moorena producens JHB]
MQHDRFTAEVLLIALLIAMRYTGFFPYSRLPTPDSRLPTPDSLC